MGRFLGGLVGGIVMAVLAMGFGWVEQGRQASLELLFNQGACSFVVSYFSGLIRFFARRDFGVLANQIRGRNHKHQDRPFILFPDRSCLSTAKNLTDRVSEQNQLISLERSIRRKPV